jgi:hypothetical protein
MEQPNSALFNFLISPQACEQLNEWTFWRIYT